MLILSLVNKALKVMKGFTQDQDHIPCIPYCFSSAILLKSAIL